MVARPYSDNAKPDRNSDTTDTNAGPVLMMHGRHEGGVFGERRP